MKNDALAVKVLRWADVSLRLSSYYQAGGLWALTLTEEGVGRSAWIGYNSASC